MAYDDSNWRQEYQTLKVLTEKQIDLLTNGATSWSGAMYIGAMFQDWKRIKGYKDPEPPNCQSSFKEWNDSINE